MRLLDSQGNTIKTGTTYWEKNEAFFRACEYYANDRSGYLPKRPETNVGVLYMRYSKPIAAWVAPNICVYLKEVWSWQTTAEREKGKLLSDSLLTFYNDFAARASFHQKYRRHSSYATVAEAGNHPTVIGLEGFELNLEEVKLMMALQGLTCEDINLKVVTKRNRKNKNEQAS